MFLNKNIEFNRFKKRTNRFKNPTFVEEKYSGFDFNNNLKSNHIAELCFTNFVSSDKCKKYYELEKICTKIAMNNNEWSKLFIADELDINKEIPKMERLYKIISIVNNYLINKNDIILKFKNLQDQEIQFYIKKEEGILRLYLIDLYHLGIEAENKKTKRIDLKGIYKAREKCSHNIESINSKIKELVG